MLRTLMNKLAQLIQTTAINVRFSVYYYRFPPDSNLSEATVLIFGLLWFNFKNGVLKVFLIS
ncbi:hypothetical protein AVD48_15405 [Salmonella enterica subsp. enterica serovar Java]|nr:hypothetical protein [Salmonella enterica]EBV8497081.1 hypothetical protein [Salmonella enterica subsp. enterica serovar Java]EAV0849158.1 hypothetical protein [Salmonella enterica]EBI4218328.1 hypothetical protein [Salmonella enterica]EBW5120817.1 hypothetical protein [Salmonella enterica subsp. enterica serovar Java]